MTSNKRSPVDDLRGASQLAVEATKGVTGVVEDMHRTIAAGPAVLGQPLRLPARLVTGVVYGSIRAVTSLVGAGLDVALEQLAPLLGEGVVGQEREAVLAALNGVLGDYLDKTDNPLAIEMGLHYEAPSPELERSRKLLVMVHGSCMNDQLWCRLGHNHGAALAGELGYTPLYLHYNSGRHISANGDEFAVVLDRLVETWPAPVDEIVMLAHSMGGLVARSACHAAETAELRWREKLRAMVFLGTPHHGAPLERGGNWLEVMLGISRYSKPLARLGRLRSAGVTDLRFGNVLAEHWQGRDRFKLAGDPRTPLPLPQDVACYAIAGTSDSRAMGALAGDGLVPVDSALGVHSKPEMTLAFPEAHKWTAQGIGHLDLLNRNEVFHKMRSWLN